MTDDEQPIPIANPIDDVYEFLDTDELNERASSILERYFGAGALVQYKPATQIAIGGASGWAVGYIFKKVGKFAASAVGGGLLMIQVANQCGYIKIDWTRVNRDVERRRRNLPAGIPRETQNFFIKAMDLAKQNAPISLGFAAGVLLGIST